MEEKTNNFSKACKELYICLKNIDVELFDKIPIELYRIILENLDKDYYFQYDCSKEFYEQNLLDETKNLLGYIYYNYWANEEEKFEFKKNIINNSK